ncbi:MAG: energy transducer TonB [bacterium]|nr:energy transducer TonB [bacterium]
MSKQFNVILVLSMLVLLTGPLWASGDIVVQLRLYQGFNENGNSSGFIVSSYYLKKMSGGGKVIPYTEGAKERDALKRIYKLKKVTQVARLDMVLARGRAGKLGHEVKLNGRKLWLSLANVQGKKDRFDIRITEKGKQKVLMESEIIVPKGKTAVLGFKDSTEKIYFLAFNRENKKSLTQTLAAGTVAFPKLLHIEEPVYPGEAIKKGIAGEVVVMGETGLKGKIAEVKVLHGDPVLAKATKKALARWKYSPWKVDGKVKAVHFVMIFVYKLIGKGGPDVDSKAIAHRYAALIDANKTKKPVPWIMEMVTTSGRMAQSGEKKSLAGKMPARTMEPPKLLHIVEPKYPGDALKKHIAGEVVVLGDTDLKGNIARVNVLHGHPILADSTKKALSKWKYSPWKVNGKVKAVSFAMIFIYRLKGKPGKDSDAVAKQYDSLIETNKTEKSVPWIMEMVIVSGKAGQSK